MADDTILEWEEHLERLREKGKRQRQHSMDFDDTEIGPAIIDFDQWTVG